MNLKALRSVLFCVSALCALIACSGGGAGTGVAEETDRRVADWGAFVGLDPAAAQQALDQAGLSDQVGKDAALSEAQLQAFLELSRAHDREFSQGIEELNRRNQKAFDSFFAARLVSNESPELQPSLDKVASKSLAEIPSAGKIVETVEKEDPGIGRPDEKFGDAFLRIRELRQTALDDYAAMSAQAFSLRGRLVEGARLLGLGLAPASMREILDDPSFAALRDAFASPVVGAIFAKDIAVNFQIEKIKEIPATASPEEIRFAAEPLANVSFKAGDRFVSFYRFAAVFPAQAQEPSDGTIEILTPRDPKISGTVKPPPPDKRGDFKVLPAGENPFFEARDRLGFEKEEIKK